MWHLPPVLPCSDRPPPRIDHTGRRSIKIPNRLWYGKWAGLMSTLRTYICWNISSGSFLRKIIFFHLPNGSQKCISKWSYCPEMLAPFLKLILKSTSFSISYHLDQPLPSSRPRYNVENRVYLLIFTPRPPVKFLWSKMGCTDLPHIVLHILCSTRTCWGHFRPLKVSFNAFLAVLGQ